MREFCAWIFSAIHVISVSRGSIAVTVLAVGFLDTETFHFTKFGCTTFKIHVKQKRYVYRLKLDNFISWTTASRITISFDPFSTSYSAQCSVILVNKTTDKILVRLSDSDILDFRRVFSSLTRMLMCFQDTSQHRIVWYSSAHIYMTDVLVYDPLNVFVLYFIT